MNHLTLLRSRLLGLFAALLILTQSLLAMGVSAFHTVPDDTSTQKTEVSKNVVAGVDQAEMAIRVTFTPILYYWVSRTFSWVDAPVIRYLNCQAFFVNPITFNAYYTHLSALAP